MLSNMLTITYLTRRFASRKAQHPLQPPSGRFFTPPAHGFISSSTLPDAPLPRSMATSRSAYSDIELTDDQKVALQAYYYKHSMDMKLAINDPRRIAEFGAQVKHAGTYMELFATIGAMFPRYVLSPDFTLDQLPDLMRDYIILKPGGLHTPRYESANGEFNLPPSPKVANASRHH